LAYTTPAGGAVVTPVSPIGMHDRERCRLAFTTSRGFGRKLERIEQDARVALAFHAREHGFSRRPGFVLGQGRALVAERNPALDARAVERATLHLGAPRHGRFWDWWLDAYYDDRLFVWVDVDRITIDDPSGRRTLGALPAGPPAPQGPPAKGTGPRIPAEAAAHRLAALPHRLVAYRDSDGYPTIVAVDVVGGDDEGIDLLAGPGLDLPLGGRRAGLLGHRFNPQVAGMKFEQHTGWLSVDADGGARYAPHTRRRLYLPHDKTFVLLANGLAARIGRRRARSSVTA
jgi:hypothetical protein